jgi:RNase H-fold protein (predicted Holliday junction resolvase)
MPISNHKPKKIPNILAIDRWASYLGTAYYNTIGRIVMPVGSLANDETMLYSLAALIEQYHIGTVLVGYPRQSDFVQKQVDRLIKQLALLDDKLIIEKVNEEYSTVVAKARMQEVLWNHQPDDTVAAMCILEWWVDWNAAKL